MDEKNSKTSSTSGNSDVETNKTIAALSYLIFFLPLLAAKDSKFAMYHCNQATVMFVAIMIGTVVGMVIPFIGWFLITPAVMIAWLVFLVIGIKNAMAGEMKPLPIIGKYTIIKS